MSLINQKLKLEDLLKSAERALCTENWSADEVSHREVGAPGLTQSNTDEVSVQ